MTDPSTPGLLNIRPAYNTAAPAEWEPVSPPPYDFLGVTMRVFPLLADLHRLQGFCDSYLNLMPREIAFFRPSVPLVLLVLVDYGKMVSEVRQIGWVSQRETAFIVPLAWMREVDGEEVFVDWASVAPYIFVDQPMSVATGREVYGWPKERGWFEPGTDSWTDVHETVPFRFQLSTKVYPHQPPEPGLGVRTLYTIRERPSQSLFGWPPSVETILNPFRTMSHLLGSSQPLITAATGMWSSALRGGPESWNASARVMMEMIGAVWPLANTTELGNPVSNTINLKQFRDASDPSLLCYQALTNARMIGLRYGSASLMGTPSLLSGDPSGGFEVDIHAYSSYPIVQHLGLLTRPTKRNVDRLKPLFPFEIDLDLRYRAGEIVCWRSKHFDWCTSEEPGPIQDTPPGYNTTLGKHEAPLPGTFDFADVTVRMLALKADPAHLQKLADDLINDAYEKAEGTRPFRATLPFVLFSATNFCSDPVGGEINCWRDREIAFYVPLERAGADGEPEIWFMAPVVFANDEVAVITLREVTGLPVSQGAITSPRDKWMSPDPGAAQPLVRIHSEVVTDANADIPQSQHVVLSLERDRQLAQLAPSLDKNARKGHQRLMVQIRTDGLLRLVTLKQFRDVRDPKLACYQAVVEETVRYTSRDHGEMDEPLVLRICSYPSQPIVDTLGLEVAETIPGATDGSRPSIDIVAPCGGFWIQGSMSHNIGLNRDVFPPPPEPAGRKAGT